MSRFRLPPHELTKEYGIFLQDFHRLWSASMVYLQFWVTGWTVVIGHKLVEGGGGEKPLLLACKVYLDSPSIISISIYHSQRLRGIIF